MEIEITQEILDEVNIVLNNKLVSFLNNQGLSFSAMAFIVQSLINAIDNAQNHLDND